MEKQRKIDFTRGDQLGLLRELQIPDGPGIKGSTAKHALRAIDDFGQRCYASADAIAAAAGMSRRTAKRARNWLRELGLIVADEVKRRNPYGTVTLHIRIDWTEVELRTRRHFATNPTPVSDLAHGATVSAHGATVSAHGATVSAHGATVAPNPPLSAHDPPPSGACAKPAAEEGVGVCNFSNQEKPGPANVAPAETKHGLVALCDGLKTTHQTSRPNSDLVSRLESVGLSPLTAGRLARDFAPQAIDAALAEFAANRRLFRHAGAIVVRLREGAWPVAVPPPRSQAELDAAAKLAQAKRYERVRCEVLRDLQSRGLWPDHASDEDLAELVGRRLGCTC